MCEDNEDNAEDINKNMSEIIVLRIYISGHVLVFIYCWYLELIYIIVHISLMISRAKVVDSMLVMTYLFEYVNVDTLVTTC